MKPHSPIKQILIVILNMIHVGPGQGPYTWRTCSRYLHYNHLKGGSNLHTLRYQMRSTSWVIEA